MNINYRIMFHFLMQLIMTFIAMFLFVVLIILLLMYLFTNDELKSNPQKAIVENLPYSASIGAEGQFELNDSWQKRLREHEMWLQVVDKNGNVIYQLNTPNSIQQSYTLNELLLIEETNQLGVYTVNTYFETWEPQPYYYLFGNQNKQQQLLTSWYDTYSDGGIVRENQKAHLEQELGEYNGMIDVYQYGELVETIGNSLPTPSDTLDVIGSIHIPGNYETKVYVVNDIEESSAWVYHEVNPTYKSPFLQIFSNREIETYIIIALISLLIPILLSIWNGYRYGKPLLLFMNWIKIVEQKQFNDVLSGKVHQKIYKKNDKVKFRYRLYKDVFESLSNMAEKLALAERERKQLEKTREEWMAGISHDLRTPLSSIQGYGHLLESGQYDFTNDELKQMGQVIRDKSDYMVDLVNDFSLVFHLKNSAITIQKEQTDLNHFVSQLVGKYQDDLTVSNYSITFEPADIPCEVKIDTKWFTRVIDNLLSNAIKHNPPETKIHVKVICTPHETGIQITDNGKGMDETSVNHLFTRYYRGTSTNERTEGEGLGMSIANAIVELHGGIIEVQSKVGKGTKVLIKL